MSRLRLLAVVLVPFLTLLPACGDGDGGGGTPDAGTPDSGTPDSGQPPAETLALERAFSADGTAITATFSAPLDAASVEAADFTVLADGAAADAAVSGVSVDGDTATLTLDAALPEGPTYTLAVADVDAESGDTLDPAQAEATLEGTLYLALVWHQHQPSYRNPAGDYLMGPWVRKHATKDYYDMVAMLGDYPDIHVQVNLTPILLSQLQLYLDKLGPYVDTAAGTIDIAGYFAQRPDGLDTPVTDPWIDMLLTDTPDPAELTDRQRGWYYEDVWSNLSISEVMIARFPAYEALRVQRDEAPETFTQEDLLDLKCWFELAWFDPSFLRGPVTLPDGSVVDLSSYVTEQADGTFTLDEPFTEESCRALVVEEYKVLDNVVAAHRALMYDAEAKTGQVEVMTTPFYHPILPLLQDTELAREAMPNDPMPSTRFEQPGDAAWHVAKAAASFQERFGQPVTGMWPAEGSVAEAVVPHFVDNGVRWIASDRRILEKSTPPDQPIYSPYRLDVDDQVGDAGDTDDELAIVFRDTEISDKIGFHYQGNLPQENVADLMDSLRGHAPAYGQDALLTVILDGENAWEWYRKDNDAKGFLNGMYAALTDAQQTGEVVTVTVSEYLDGNESRNVPAHPVHDLPELEPLFAGSWISGSFSTWIGEPEENLAWDYLDAVREQMDAWVAAGLPTFGPEAAAPEAGTADAYAYEAWQNMFAAEGSDWFWWYGGDQTAVGGDEPFDRIYIELLQSVFANVQAYGDAAGNAELAAVTVPDLAPILRTCNPPQGPLADAPVVDGAFDPDDGGDPEVANEWTELGAGVCMDVDSGVADNPDDVIATWYHGVDEGEAAPGDETLYVAFRMNWMPVASGGDFQVRLYFPHRHIVSLDPKQLEEDSAIGTTVEGEPLPFDAARVLTVDYLAGTPEVTLADTDGVVWNAAAAAPSVMVGSGTDVIELGIPLDLLNWSEGDPLRFVATAVADGVEVDRLPNVNSVVVYADRSELVEVVWVLDATGNRLDLDAVNSGLANPDGTAFIVGNLDALANWSPNTVAMADDGSTYGDAVAGDGLWTFSTLVSPGTEVNYKYTVGSEGESWGPTEEFPLTNRGLLVNDLNGNGRMEIHDVFADRPADGSQAPMSEVVDG